MTKENELRLSVLKQWAPYVILLMNVIFFAGIFFSEGKASSKDVEDIKEFKKNYQSKIDVMASDIKHIQEMVEIIMKRDDKQDDRLNNFNK